MKKYFAILILTLLATTVNSQQQTINSPDGNLRILISIEDGIPFYSVNYKETIMLENSPLGLMTSIGDFSKELQIIESVENKIEKKYNQDKIKQSTIHYSANRSHWF